METSTPAESWLLWLHKDDYNKLDHVVDRIPKYVKFLAMHVWETLEKHPRTLWQEVTEKSRSPTVCRKTSPTTGRPQDDGKTSPSLENRRAATATDVKRHRNGIHFPKAEVLAGWHLVLFFFCGCFS